MYLPAAKRRRRWFQFSLRTLLIVTAAAAGLAFGYAKLIEPYRRQREAMAVITKLGGTYKTEDATGWVRYLDKNAQDVLVVDLGDCDKPDEYLPHLVRLSKLRTLVVGGFLVKDKHVTALGRATSLRGLVLDSPFVTDAAVGTLKEALPDLVVCKSYRRTVGSRFWWCDAVPPDWLLNDVGVRYFHADVEGVDVPFAQ